MLIGISIALILHRQAAMKAARNWRADAIPSASLWLLPAVCAGSVVVVAAAGLAAVGLAHPDFMTLLISDWQQPSMISIWLTCIGLAMAVPPGAAAAIGGSQATKQIEG
jgi:hypothetical protein